VEQIIKTIIQATFCFVLVVPVVAHGQIRRYNPETGTMTSLPSYGGNEPVDQQEIDERNSFYRTSDQSISLGRGVTMQTARDSAFEVPTSAAPAATGLGRPSMSDAAMTLQAGARSGDDSGPGPEARYGFALALIDKDAYGEKRVFNNLLALEAVDGMMFRTYIKEEGSKDPKQAAQDMPLPKWMMQYRGESPTFRFDKRNKLATLYQVKDKDYPVLIYQDPKGERRYYSIASSIDSFRKKYEQVRKEVDAKR
jgi:hypothetical protein